MISLSTSAHQEVFFTRVRTSLNPRRMKSSAFIFKARNEHEVCRAKSFLLTWRDMTSYQFETKSQQIKSTFGFC